MKANVFRIPRKKRTSAVASVHPQQRPGSNRGGSQQLCPDNLLVPFSSFLQVVAKTKNVSTWGSNLNFFLDRGHFFLLL
jgi:hypothetical protein